MKSFMLILKYYETNTLPGLNADFISDEGW